MKNSAILLLQCPDRKGLDAAIADFIYWHGGDILHFEQHQAGEERFYLARVEWDLTGFEFDLKDFPKWFAPIAEQFSIRWRITSSNYRPRVAIFVSKYDHCLVDLLYRQRIGELACEIPLMISNHPDARHHADFYDVPYHVNHSFLPAFVGAKPHHQAFQRGVKLIGATAHYVTEVLDDGPIIEQNVARISHRDTVEDLVQKGRDLEKLVLSRAVRWHIENRILLYGNKTVIFE